MAARLEPGQQAPDFTLPDASGRPVSLSGLRGRRVVVYFYPKAETPGCTTQACDFRDSLDRFAAEGFAVLGISPDAPEALAKFTENQSLTFPLLSDADLAVAEAYGAWGEKSMYGKTYMGVTRSTFLIDEEGIVRHVIPKASPKTHDDVVLKALAEMAAAAQP
jgi:peroxiredoxin Q/BCP